MRRRERRPEPVQLPAGVELPGELLDPQARVWWSFTAHRDYMQARGWPMQARDRVRVIDPQLVGTEPAATSPVAARGRRLRAAQAWAQTHGLALNGRGHPDWESVRMLLDGPEALRSAARAPGRRKEAAA